MTTAIKRRRGTTAEHSTFVGLEGEITIDSTKDTVVVHDGSTVGGFPLAKESGSSISAVNLTASGTVTIPDNAISGDKVEGGTINAITINTLSANPTLSAGTANGVAYLNGSKVLTTGSALTFDGSVLGVNNAGDSDFKLTTSNTGSGSTDGLLLRINSTGSEAYLWNWEPSSVLIFGVSGSEQMRLTSTGLGIGTSSPTNKLSVTGNADITGYMGVGGAPLSSAGVYIRPTSLLGVSVYGARFRVAGTSSNTTSVQSIYSAVETAAGSYTVTNVNGARFADAVLGSGVTITYQRGLYVEDQSKGTYNYGFESAVSSGTNKWNIYASGTAANYFEGNVGIGTSSPSAKLDVQGGLAISNSSASYWKLDRDNTDGSLTFTDSYINEAMRIDSAGNLGLGVTPSAWTSSWKAFDLGSGGLALTSSGTADARVTANSYFDGTNFRYKNTGAATAYRQTSGAHQFLTAPSGTAGSAISFTQAMTLDASGNLLVGTTSAFGNTGITIDQSGQFFASRSSNPSVIADRRDSDGDVFHIRKNGTTVGSIGVGGSNIYCGSSNVNLLFGGSFATPAVVPVNSDGSARDNAIDIGALSIRFDDIYATNGTIQTSDRNEKQDIETLSEAEARVAVACKGLLRKFRWKDSVAEKGDEARIHFGIIAQDLQDAFSAEGLDAGRYAMFISSTWNDEETGEERTRLGVRYPELLAFIIAAI